MVTEEVDRGLTESSVDIIRDRLACLQSWSSGPGLTSGVSTTPAATTHAHLDRCACVSRLPKASRRNKERAQGKL